ncbi:MAG: T9SS type A sorting domain-containing protein [Bacteroidales bacterium]|nr:T9SS type A sorting domain-containing protein [Bacteroidales bacterium]
MKHIYTKLFMAVVFFAAIHKLGAQSLPDGDGLMGTYFNLSAATKDFLAIEKSDKIIPDYIDLFDGDIAGNRISPEPKGAIAVGTDYFEIDFNYLPEKLPAVGDLDQHLNDLKHFAVRWEGFIKSPLDGAVTFYAIGDNGFRVWIGDTENPVPCIDLWSDVWDVELSKTMIMSSDSLYKIKIEYFENYGGNYFKLRWNAPGFKQSVQRKYLYSQNLLNTSTGESPAMNRFSCYSENGLLYINHAAIIESVEIYTVSGQLVYTNTKLGEYNPVIDISRLNQGLYMVKSNSTSINKIIVR